MRKDNARSSRLGVTRGAVLCCALLGLPVAALGAEAPPAPAEMWRIIQQQQREIERLKAKLEVTDRKVGKAAERIEATSEMVEKGVSGAPAKATWAERTSIGGYGELHYNNLDDGLERIDFHRFVLFVGHEFNDRIRFMSELEVEHAFIEDTGGETPGEIELEQAWLELDIDKAQNHHLRAGLDVIPVGILNPTHEPPTFFGVERNNVEGEIIPTTWWEPGIALLGQFAPGWNYHLMVHDGLKVPTTGGKAFRIRSGRQKGAKADAETGAVTAQLRYTGMPGLEIGVTGQYQQDITQGALDIDATLFAAHADWRRGPFGLRALFARWDLDDGSATTGPATGPSPGRDEQYGWYVEPSFRFRPAGVLPGEIGIFARFSQFNRNAGDASLDKDDNQQFDAGVNYWPHPDVVFKFDIQQQMGDATVDGINLGVGLQY